MPINLKSKSAINLNLASIFNPNLSVNMLKSGGKNFLFADASEIFITIKYQIAFSFSFRFQNITLVETFFLLLLFRCAAKGLSSVVHLPSTRRQLAISAATRNTFYSSFHYNTLFTLAYITFVVFTSTCFMSLYLYLYIDTVWQML